MRGGVPIHSLNNWKCGQDILLFLKIHENTANTVLLPTWVSRRDSFAGVWGRGQMGLSLCRGSEVKRYNSLFKSNKLINEKGLAKWMECGLFSFWRMKFSDSCVELCAVICAAQYGSQQHPVATEYLKYGKWDSKIQFKILLNCNYFKFK